MKRTAKLRALLAVCVSILGIALLLVCPTYAGEPNEPAPAFLTDEQTAAAGSTIDICISLQNNPGISSIVLQVDYDASLLTLKSVRYNSEIGGQSVPPASLQSPLTLYWVNGLADTAGDFTFATLTFAVKSTARAGSRSAVTISYDPNNVYNIAEENLDFAVVNGGVTVVNCIPGDINNDGIVNNKDVNRLMQYHAKWSVSVNEAALDVNGDGQLNNKDVTRLMQYVANWQVEIFPKVPEAGCLHEMSHVAGQTPTCTESGHTAYWTCSACEKIFADEAGEQEITLADTLLAATDHTPVADPAIPPTCMQEGKMAGSHCAVCRTVLVPQVTVPATDHTYAATWSHDEGGHWRESTCGCGIEAMDDAEHSFVEHICSVCRAAETFSVTFEDHNGSVLDIQYVPYGASATLPAEPSRNGYRFDRWSGDTTNITADITVRAIYVKQYTVRFIGIDGETLGPVQTVDEGGSAIAPAHPLLDGYTANGWDKPFDAVRTNLTVTACYTRNTYTVTYILPDRTVIPYTDYLGNTAEHQSVEHGSTAIPPVAPEFYYDWSVNHAFGFTQWVDGNGDSFDFSTGIRENTVITAAYSAPYETPVMAMRRPDLSLTLSNLSTAALYGMELKLQYKTGMETEGVHIMLDAQNGVEFNTGAAWWLGTEQDQRYTLDINNNTKELSFAWSGGVLPEPVIISTFSTFIQKIHYGVDGGDQAAFADCFVISHCELIVSYDNGATFQRITPQVVYG